MASCLKTPARGNTNFSIFITLFSFLFCPFKLHSLIRMCIKHKCYSTEIMQNCLTVNSICNKLRHNYWKKFIMFIKTKKSQILPGVNQPVESNR